MTSTTSPLWCFVAQLCLHFRCFAVEQLFAGPFMSAAPHRRDVVYFLTDGLNVLGSQWKLRWIQLVFLLPLLSTPLSVTVHLFKAADECEQQRSEQRDNCHSAFWSHRFSACVLMKWDWAVLLSTDLFAIFSKLLRKKIQNSDRETNNTNTRKN